METFNLFFSTFIYNPLGGVLIAIAGYYAFKSVLREDRDEFAKLRGYAGALAIILVGIGIFVTSILSYFGLMDIHAIP